MCKLKSAIILKDRIFMPDYDSHSKMLEELGIVDDYFNASKVFVKAELVPENKDVFSDIDRWKLEVDQDITPEWFDEKDCAERMRKAVKEWANTHIFIGQNDLKISHGENIFIKDCKNVDICGDAKVKYICGDTTVKSIGGDATVKNIYGNSMVKSIYGKASVECIYDNATVESIYGNASIECIRDNVTVGCIRDNVTVEDFCDNASVEYVYGDATINYVYGNAAVANIGSNVRINSICEHATITNVYGDATAIGSPYNK